MPETERSTADVFVRLTEVYENYKGNFIRTALRKGMRYQDAEDAIQEAFILGLRKANQLIEIDAAAGWMRTTLKRACVNLLVRGSKLPVVDYDPDFVCDELKENEMRFDESEQLAKAMKLLKPLDAEALTDYYLEGLSMKKISRLRATPIGTIKRRLFYARQRLRNVMDSLERRDTTPRTNVA